MKTRFSGSQLIKKRHRQNIVDDIEKVVGYHNVVEQGPNNIVVVDDE